MIELIEGTIGSGKTYFGVFRIAGHLAQGGTVFTNVDCVWEGMRAYVMSLYGVVPVESQLVRLERDTVQDFDEHISYGSEEIAVLVVLDETQLNWNAKDHAKFSRRLFAFLTQSRKCDVNLLIVTQDIRNVDPQFRRLAQFVYRTIDSSTWELPGWGVVTRGYFFMGKLDARNGTLMKRMIWKKDKRIFAAYRTKALLGGFEGLQNRVEKVCLEKVRREPLAWLTPQRRRGLKVLGGFLTVVAVRILVLVFVGY